MTRHKFRVGQTVTVKRDSLTITGKVTAVIRYPDQPQDDIDLYGLNDRIDGSEGWTYEVPTGPGYYWRTFGDNQEHTELWRFDGATWGPVVGNNGLHINSTMRTTERPDWATGDFTFAAPLTAPTTEDNE